MVNFPEQTDYLRRYFSFCIPTGWNGNYRSICTKFPFLLLALTLRIVPSREVFLSTKEIVFRPYGKGLSSDTENFRNFKPKILAKGKAPKV